MSGSGPEAGSWKCLNCGWISSAEDAMCTDCARAAPRMFLTSVLSGVSRGIALRRTVFGRPLLSYFDPDDALYADTDAQFVVERGDESWIIRNGFDPKHATHLDGKPIMSEGVVLQKAGVLTVGKSRLALRITFGS